MGISHPFPAQVHELVADAVISLEPALRGDLCANVVLCGGVSKLPNLDARLKRDADPLLQYPVSVAKRSDDASLLAFRGAALLAGDKRATYLSRADWAELGPDRLPGGGAWSS